MAVGAMEMVLAGVLGLLAAVAAASLVVALVASIWLSVTPVFAQLADRVQRWRWRDWHPPTQWIPDHVALEEPRSLWPPRVRGMSYLPAGEVGVDGTVGLMTAQVATSTRSCGPQYEMMTMLHTRLAQPTTLDLPARDGCSTVLYVLAGEGTVGADHQKVRAGETVLVPSGPVPVVADDRGRGLEMLVLERVPSAAAETAGEGETPADAAEAFDSQRRPFALASKVLHPHRPAHA